MTISDQEFERLKSFIGYGNPDAKVWFLGPEERLDRDVDAERNLRIRSTFNEVEDLWDACKKLGITKHHTGSRVLAPTWRRMCELMLRLDHDIDDWRATDTDSKRDYQSERLGRKGDDTFLTELMPVPCPSVSDWHDTETLPQFDDREEYERCVRPERIAKMRKFLAEHKPKLVVAYNKSYWIDFARLFPGTEFNGDFRSAPFTVGHGEPSVILTAALWTRQFDKNAVEIARNAKAILSGQYGGSKPNPT